MLKEITNEAEPVELNDEEISEVAGGEDDGLPHGASGGVRGITAP